MGPLAQISLTTRNGAYAGRTGGHDPCVQKFAFSNSLRGKNAFREADRWICAEDDCWPFSFTNICDLLGFDPAWIRMGLGSGKKKPK